MQRLHENEHDNVVSNCKNKNKEKHVDCATLDENENKKLVYASIMAESDNDDDDRGIELVIMPSGMVNPIEISSNEIDDELYDSFVKSVTGPEETMVSTPFRKANTTKKQNFGKHKDIEKVYQKRKTKSKRRH
jgi:hypothetical protein